MNIIDEFESVIMNLESWLNECYLRYKRQRWDFCEEFTLWNFATKCAAVKFVKSWMSNHFSSKNRDLGCDGSILFPECPRNDWRSKSCWLKPRERGPEVVQEPGGVTASAIFLGRSWHGASRIFWASRNFSRIFSRIFCLTSVRYFESS